MIIKAWASEKVLRFKNPAQTSRNTLYDKTSHYIFLENESGQIGTGECSPIYGLSMEGETELRQKISEVVYLLNHRKEVADLDLEKFPSLRFAVEVAKIDLDGGGNGVLFNTSFTSGRSWIKTNGLIWMGSQESMKKQLHEKIENGFRCIKIKIGSHDFKKELNFLKELRREYGSIIELRLDANGAFKIEDALEKLNSLEEYHIHSIEQPIRQGNWKEMAKLCAHSPIDIALDEELIGINEMRIPEFLKIIKPQYIILKPSLIGGLNQCEKWIKAAGELDIGWWATSFLESNIGLNAISQWVSQFDSELHQGLGTGNIYENNVISPLLLKGENLYYNTKKILDLAALEDI